jgi:hypothetical protein
MEWGDNQHLQPYILSQQVHYDFMARNVTWTVNTTTPSKKHNSFNVWKGKKDTNIHITDTKAKKSYPAQIVLITQQLSKNYKPHT